MDIVQTRYGRRSFLKTTALAGGGLLIGFNHWLDAVDGDKGSPLPDTWFEINSYLKIGSNGVVTILCPNPEFGQNVRTSMPMIVAEELDVDWKNVLVEQAPFNIDLYTHTRQFTGGSQGIRRGWQGLRMAGATARHMLRVAAAQLWQVPEAEITTDKGMLYHAPTRKSAGYGALAEAAAKVPVPKEVKLKSVADFKVIGASKKNVDGMKIVTGQPMFGLDYHQEGMLIAMVVHPPAFGMKLKSVDSSSAKAMPGIRDVFPIQTLPDSYARQMFDVCTFPELVAVVGNSTWEVMQAVKALRVSWEPFSDHELTWLGWDGKAQTRRVPGGLEGTSGHLKAMAEAAAKPAKLVRKDGEPEAAFTKAAKIIERTFTAPFLAHNCMEPMNFFANVTPDKVHVAGPLQAPELIERTLAARLGVPKEKIEIEMTRMGGGFGRRAYSHHLVEAALISQQVKAPVKLMYSREDDMTYGVYRPAYSATYRAALDAQNNLIAFHVKAGGIPESPLGHAANRFPAGAVENYLAEEWVLESNITVGAFRAPASNFMAAAEQSFLDEVAEAAGKDPIDFRLELLDKAKRAPVGKNNDYEPDRYAGVLKLVREKSTWNTPPAGMHRGLSAYFCHNSYVAQVLDLKMEQGTPRVQRVCCAIDCGVVINPDAARNMAEGAIVDGIGNALFGAMTFREGAPTKTNFDRYRMIRMSEAPKAIDVHFVQNQIDPTGMGEPPFPPIFGALANALYRATGKRFTNQPFLSEEQSLG